MEALQDPGDGAKRGDIRSGEHQMASRPENPIDLRHHEHRISRQVLKQLAAQDGGEKSIGVRKAVAFGVKQVDAALELLAGFAGDRFTRVLARAPVVASENFAIAEARL